ncbi:MAG: four-carbon acid sugar kinase family protein [Bacteroidota bacterium]
MSRESRGDCKMINAKNLLAKLPPTDKDFSKPCPPPQDLVIVVLDDDPTGTQTVHDVLVITQWTVEILTEAFQEPIFYVLTNSRSLSNEEAYNLVGEICRSLARTADELKKQLLIITRGDSTLRGHFLTETQAVVDHLFLKQTLIAFVPAFFEGGRYTIENVHYVQEGDRLIPVSETPFAEDKTFGFNCSNLYEYIIEKDNSIDRTTIFDLSIDEIRADTTDQLLAKILDHKNKKYLNINATDQSDLNKVAKVLTGFPALGNNLLIRSAASLVPSMAGIDLKPALSVDQMSLPAGQGLIVVGSYVPKSTNQLKYLLEHNQLSAHEIDVTLLSGARKNHYIGLCADAISRSMNKGNDCVVFTSRKLQSGQNAEMSLQIVNEVANGINSIISGLKQAPSFLIAKGGITSSDIATKVLNIKKARVMGQLLAGVPVWKPSEHSKFPDMPYIIFPGNVGNEDSLSLAYRKMKMTH